MLKRIIYTAIALLLFVAAFIVPDWFAEYKKDLDLNNFQEQFILKENILNQSIQEVDSVIKDSDRFYKIYRENNIAIFLYDQEVLKRWNQDELKIDEEIFRLSNGVYQFPNGWYYLKTKSLDSNLTVVALLKLKSQYSYQNKHLKAEFSKAFQFQTIDKINKDNEGKAIFNSNGKELFYLSSKPNFSSSEYQALIFFLCYVLSLLFLSQGINIKNQSTQVICRLFLVLLYRFTLYFLSPEYLEYVEFFRPNWYAINDWIPSFADFVLNSVLIFYLTIELNKLFDAIKLKHKFIVKSVLAILIGILTVEWVASSIVNSTYSYDLANFFEWNIFSLCSLVCFSILFIAAINFIESTHLKTPKASDWVIIIVSAILLSLFISNNENVNLYHFWVLIPIVSFHFLNRKSFRSLLIIGNLVFLSIIAAFLITGQYEEREESKKQIILKKLAEEKDVVAEYLFQSIDSLISNDSILESSLLTNRYDINNISDYLNGKYFSGYWNKYSILYYPCYEGDTILLNNEYSLSCFDYYHDRIKYEGEKIQNTSFYQISNLAGRIDYLAEIKFPLEDSTNINLYIELSSSIVNQFEGYPELLIDERSNSNHLDLSKYSYAVYHRDNLVFKSGNYNYPISSLTEYTDSSQSYKYLKNGYNHLLLDKNKDTKIILSEKEDDLTNQITRIAYLLILCSAVVSVLSIFPFGFNMKIQLNWSDFSSRIQVFLLSTLLLAVTLFLIGTLFYIQKQNEEKNNKVISEKLRSVRVELESKVGGESEYNDSLITYYNALLIKFSNVFYTDINLFDNSGHLFATSRPEIFAKGLKGKRIHPKAFSKVVEHKKSEWVQREHIGNMEYISAYVPIRNDYDKILGYLNLPYFAKQEELENEISEFFVSTVNIYVAIFALALFISVLLVNQLSRPLSLIRQQISKLKLGGDLELIEWKGNDEIGALVKEYNRMVVELSDSVERLAQSEREGAWREMAKQVAHEIKNPLTPMKLSIQHLKMAYERKAEDLDSRIEKTSKTLIEQIDTLTNIANEFSHFAKMPQGNLSKVNLISIIDNAIHLYDTYEEVSISLNSIQKEVYVNGDENQLIRVFNNLIKNSIQAKRIDSSLDLKITIQNSTEEYLIDITDNGIGVSKDKREKIFEPNFTTKSSGTGLGLAMSRNILNNMGGSIKLMESKIGAHFRVTIPTLDKD